MQDLAELILHMTEKGALKSIDLIQAFETMDRRFFVAESQQKHCYEDRPLPIGLNQTISQPSTVAITLEQLAPEPGQQILDIGCGSGWTSALLGQIVGKQGQVLGLDRLAELLALGQQHLQHWDLPHVTLALAGPTLGAPGHTFDRILVSAAAKTFPESLLTQLRPNGRLVIPVTHDIVVCHKHVDGRVDSEYLSGFRFVPLR
ncbi:MAG: methyltransferase domain-containing protein [bacterium]